ncbi:MAG TPA: tRNA (adenosine(37)-N6)-dimethylallyltransferase MiaA [Candidatus Omnitrophica bacterium]|nr:MAG: tRNA (adenosine(37)-N6)-dimethylallyltransferase MiaA [Omnitrophica WOR_2 bacterium GWA2_63_20]OGX16729.1 MAG: tRNA (adenosine(37)-N6)-dimethylallyltransferase MiaA [Omnitrophica WOR_2 bacterium GWF2_63_9]OGX33063.1 MAG: tRNA (adenosine(37)-N6)-dimethylallyltransferase MiaA [Omnitrophica WOR_2 bacterium RIFCSPHIGHO2_12_FULL_64_13]OGX35435.1 MAG: tRNA (adenosine(37)-N6)-dimethylallyltransferase MiaA [Omnitrophica WOR_2 bacterium RIFCSPHIGHO2_02_FULL_63_39]OGX44188.1 MAG: tRNA (adenosine(
MLQTIALVGPTAVGKTDVSIELAKRLGAEIIGCDSMQVYRGMAALTQQPALEQRAAVPHHLVDCIEPTESFSAGRYRAMALEAIEAVQRRGNTALLVGGTGLYLKALTHGLCEAPPADFSLRARLWEAIRADGSEAHHQRLARIDPVAASKIHPHDARRVVRALEVYEVTGQPLSRLWYHASGGSWGEAERFAETDRATSEMIVVGVTRPREELYERINRRVEQMIQDEAVLDEVRRLRGVSLSLTASKVHGLRFLEAYLNGEVSREETIRVWQQQVRHYARRQLTWFRANPRIQWVTLAAHERVETTVERMLNLMAEV